MSLQAELYAVVPQDVELMEACFRPMGFASRHVEDPISPAQARAWLDSCEPLFKRLGKRASEELLTGAKRLRERSDWTPGAGDTDKSRQSGINLDVHCFFERLAAEYLKHGARPHAVEQLQLQSEVVLEAFQLIHFDRKLLVPTSTDARDHDTAHAFASAPTTHTSFGRYFIWRGAAQVRAFFAPNFKLFGPPEDALLTPPSAQQLIALKHERSSWVSPSPAEALESAQGMIDAYREKWSTLVEVLRTAARFGGAFISVCQNTTDSE